MEFENTAQVWKKDAGICVLFYYFIVCVLTFPLVSHQSQKSRDEYTVVSETLKAKLLVVDVNYWLQLEDKSKVSDHRPSGTDRRAALHASDSSRHFCFMVFELFAERHLQQVFLWL